MHAIAIIGRHEGVGPNANLECVDTLWTLELESVGFVDRACHRHWVAGVAHVDDLHAFAQGRGFNMAGMLGD